MWPNLSKGQQISCSSKDRLHFFHSSGNCHSVFPRTLATRNCLFTSPWSFQMLGVTNQVKHLKYWLTNIRFLHQSTAASTWWCGPRPRLGWVEMAVGLPEGSSYPGDSPSFFRYAALWTTAVGQHTASSKSVACFLCFSSPALLRLLLLMSGNVHPNLGPIFPCSVCTGNVTWWGKSVQCCACSKWVHLRCSQLSLSIFRALGSSHSWSCLPLQQHCDSFPGLLRHVYLHCAIWPRLC